jgi:hypothetical protein
MHAVCFVQIVGPCLQCSRGVAHFLFLLMATVMQATALQLTFHEDVSSLTCYPLMILLLM